MRDVLGCPRAVAVRLEHGHCLVCCRRLIHDVLHAEGDESTCCLLAGLFGSPVEERDEQRDAASDGWVAVSDGDPVLRRLGECVQRSRRRLLRTWAARLEQTDERSDAVHLADGLPVVLVVGESPECARRVALHHRMPIEHRDEWLDAAHLGNRRLVLRAVVCHRPECRRHLLLHLGRVQDHGRRVAGAVAMLLESCPGVLHVEEADEQLDTACLGDRALVGRVRARKARDGERGLGGGLLVIRAEQRHDELRNRLLVLRVVECERCERARSLLTRLFTREPKDGDERRDAACVGDGDLVLVVLPDAQRPEGGGARFLGVVSAALGIEEVDQWLDAAVARELVLVFLIVVRQDGERCGRLGRHLLVHGAPEERHKLADALILLDGVLDLGHADGESGDRARGALADVVVFLREQRDERPNGTGVAHRFLELHLRAALRIRGEGAQGGGGGGLGRTAALPAEHRDEWHDPALAHDLDRALVGDPCELGQHHRRVRLRPRRASREH